MRRKLILVTLLVRRWLDLCIYKYLSEDSSSGCSAVLINPVKLHLIYKINALIEYSQYTVFSKNFCQDLLLFKLKFEVLRCSMKFFPGNFQSFQLFSDFCLLFFVWLIDTWMDFIAFSTWGFDNIA